MEATQQGIDIPVVMATGKLCILWQCFHVFYCQCRGVHTPVLCAGCGIFNMIAPSVFLYIYVAYTNTMYLIPYLFEASLVFYLTLKPAHSFEIIK